MSNRANADLNKHRVYTYTAFLFQKTNYFY